MSVINPVRGRHGAGHHSKGSTRRALLMLGLLTPSAAWAWLEGADAVLARADAAWTRRSVDLDLQIRWRDGRRTQARWRLGEPDQGGRPVFDASGPAGFGRAVLDTVFAHGVGVLAEGLKVDRDRRRMALINQRPAQVIGRDHHDTTARPAIWLDHQRQTVLQVATRTTELRLFDWDWTAPTPTPTRLELHQGGDWAWVAAAAVRR